MDSSEIATQLIPDEVNKDKTNDKNQDKDNNPDLNSLHDSVVKELLACLSSGSKKQEKKKKKNGGRRNRQSRSCKSDNSGDSSNEDSEDLFEDYDSEPRRDPEALRQLKILEQLQEELLELQRTFQISLTLSRHF